MSAGRTPSGGNRFPVLAVLASLAALGVVFVLLLGLGGGDRGEDGRAPGNAGNGDNPLVGLGEDGQDAGERPGQGAEGPAEGGPGPSEDLAEPVADPVADPRAGQGAEAPEAPGAGEAPDAPGQRDPGDPPPVAAGDDALGAHDPLGVLEEREAEGVHNGARLSAASFVTYCYGYSGGDAEQYTEGVEQVVFDPEFYRSEGGQAVQRVVEAIDRDGAVTAAAKLDDFRALPGIPEDEGSLRVEIRFSVGEAFAPPAEWPSGEPTLEGDARTYVQELEMAHAGGRSEVWKVYQAGPVREAS